MGKSGSSANEPFALAAAMFGPRGEHLAHLVAWAVEKGMTVAEALLMPYCHPASEEALQDTLCEPHRGINGLACAMVQLERLDREVAARPLTATPVESEPEASEPYA
jgi:hypothetical protein